MRSKIDEDDAERRQGTGDERAADAGDAAEVGDGEEAEADEHAERLRRELAPAVADQRAAEAGEERRQGEAPTA